MAGAAVGLLAITLVAAAAASTPQPARRSLRVVIDGRSIARRFPSGPSVVFRYPANWHLTKRRVDDVLDPHTLFALSTFTRLRARLDDCEAGDWAVRPTAPSSW